MLQARTDGCFLVAWATCSCDCARNVHPCNARPRPAASKLVRSMPIPSPGSHCSIVALPGLLPPACRIGAPARRGAIQSFSPRRSFQILAFHRKRETPPPFLSVSLVVHRAFFLPAPSPSDQHLPQTQSHPTVAASARPEEKRSPPQSLDRQHPSTSIHARTLTGGPARPLSFRSVGGPTRSPRR